MKILVWQWGRKGAGPRYAAELAASLATVPGTSAVLSLSAQAELLQGETPPDCAPPDCALPFPTYTGLPSLLLRLPRLPFELPALTRRLRALAPDLAICAMPAVLDLAMVTALRRAGIPFHVVVHDADPHPGDDVPLQMTLQRALIRRADGLIALTGHVADRLRQHGLVGNRPLVMTTHPPFPFGDRPPAPRHHGGKLRLLSFGRLLPYKGLDLLAETLRALGPRDDIEVRVVGQGPASSDLTALVGLPNVTVENRWVPESEVGALLAWADALVLSHREASQSGVAAAAIAARRWIVATRVGGITEQLAADPLARLAPPEAAPLAAAIASLITHPPVDTGADDPRAVWRAVAARLVRDLARG